MRKWLIVSWLLLPVLAGAYHFGPGQEQLVLDQVDAHLRSAEQAVGEELWEKAASEYELALAQVPETYIHQSRQIRLELAKVQMFNKKLPDANKELKQLVEDLTSDKNADQALLAESRSAMANSQYYITWLMRLEGLPREQWEPEIETARQTYRLLAEESACCGDNDSLLRHQEDLESAVKLARMDLKDLQGLPLPSQ
jgi:hypothetical protein